MTAPQAEVPGVVAAFRRALLAIPVGRCFVATDLPLNAAGIHGAAIGMAFTKAQAAGWIEGTDTTRRSTDPLAKGRRVVVWRRCPIGPQGMGAHRSEPDLLSLLEVSA